ncbi:MAG: cation transporter [Crocinitomicaceae bacterium]|nr:cation transporter [Crocinitomicaceae bacterium]
MRNHKDTHEHPAKEGIRVVQHGMALNAVMAILKGTSGIFGNSYALVADAIESVSDVISSALVWIGLRTAALPPDENHPYGHGKAEPVAAIIVSFMLFSASVFIAFQAVKNIQTPHELPASWTLWVIGSIVLGKELIFRYVMRTGIDTGSLAVKGEAHHHRADAITSAAAFVGIAVALIFGKGYEAADDWAALLASLFIAHNALGVFRPAFSELMDEAQPDEVIQDIRKIAETVPGVLAIEKCFVRKMGFELFVDIHVIVSSEITVREGHEIAHRVKDTIIKHRPRVFNVLTHIEPG